MGTSTDAILAFGFNLGSEEDGDLPEKLLEAGRDGNGEEDGFSFDVLAAKEAGIEPPAVEYEDDKDAWSAYWDKKRKAEETHPLEVITHCSCDCPMYFLAVRGTKVVASRGYPKEVMTLPVTPERWSAMRKFCSRYGIEWREPSWQIFSQWC